MKNFLLLLLSCNCFVPSRAQTGTVLPPEKSSYLLHKFAQHIGEESYTREKTDSGFVFKIQFKFVDRGMSVPLNATLVTSFSYEPLCLYIKGKTSRFSTINDTVRICQKQAWIRVDDSAFIKDLRSPYFTVGGYSPGTIQMLLMKYWMTHGQPETINLLPDGAVKIMGAGYDTLLWESKQLILKRYVIGGLIWGNELVWTDLEGNLVCLITNDAEADKLELMLGSYEALLPELISRAAAYGMQLFRASLAGASLKKNTPIAIIGGDLIDPAGGQTLRNAEILIDHGVIIKTGRSGDFPIPDRARVIHADGNTILPGLWDMHTHFEQAEWGPAYLAAGVTTVRDCGNEFGYINSIKQAIDRGEGIGPNILKAGIIDGAGPYALGIVRATTKEEAIAQVKRYKDNGFVQIKIYSSVKPAIVKAICEEAHALDLTVTGHIPDGMTLLQGIDSGMDMVNHIDYVYRAMKKNRDLSIDLHDSLSVRVLNQLKSHHTVIDPTLSVYELIVRSVKDDITLIEPSFYSLPVPLQALFKNMGMPPEIAARYKILMTSREEIVKALYDYGITVVAGTDGCIPGYSLDRELELYVEAGMKPIDAIRSATIIPARVMHKEKEYGSLQPGMKADLIILNGDPTQDIRKLRLVKMVIKEGEIFDPASLHRMVGFSN